MLIFLVPYRYEKSVSIMLNLSLNSNSFNKNNIGIKISKKCLKKEKFVISILHILCLCSESQILLKVCVNLQNNGLRILTNLWCLLTLIISCSYKTKYFIWRKREVFLIFFFNMYRVRCMFRMSHLINHYDLH